MLIITAMFGVYAIEARIADKAQSKADMAAQHASDIKKANEQFQAQTAIQIAALQSALSIRQQVEAKIPPSIGSAPTPQVAQAIQTATNAQSTQVTTQGDFITLALPIARDAVTALQLVPLLQADKTDLTKALDLEKQAHVSDVQACKADVLAVQADLKATKAKGRKNAIKWFFLGVVAGFAGRGAL